MGECLDMDLMYKSSNMQHNEQPNNETATVVHHFSEVQVISHDQPL